MKDPVSLTPGMKYEYFECACHSDEHRLVFRLDKTNKEFWASIFLHEYRFWTRLWRGIKYIFGYKCQYGHFDVFILEKKNVARLQSLLKEFQELEDKQ